MDFSRIDRLELIGIGCAVVALISLFFLPWYSVETGPDVAAPVEDRACGETSCTGWETFPLLRWILLIGAAAPLILAYILVTNQKLSWAPGEMTMVGAFAALVLIGYNGLLDKPGSGTGEIGVSLDIGYWVALLAGVGMAATAALRSLESGGRQQRKAPGTV